MSYFDKFDNFLEPKVNQYGSHVVMTDVSKEIKKKYINIDSRFKNEYDYNNSTSNYNINLNSAPYNSLSDYNINVANYNITLPEKITNVRSMKVLSAEIPTSYFNISANIGNNVFNLVDNSHNLTHTITIPDNQYTANTLTSAMNSALNPYNITYDMSNNISHFVDASSSSYTFIFDVGTIGNIDKYNFKSKLGWLLGFRNISYTFRTGSPLYSESFVDLNGLRYVYICVDEFSKGNQYSFVSCLLYTSPSPRD